MGFGLRAPLLVRRQQGTAGKDPPGPAPDALQRACGEACTSWRTAAEKRLKVPRESRASLAQILAGTHHTISNSYGFNWVTQEALSASSGALSDCTLATPTCEGSGQTASKALLQGVRSLLATFRHFTSLSPGVVEQGRERGKEQEAQNCGHGIITSSHRPALGLEVNL